MANSDKWFFRVFNQMFITSVRIRLKHLLCKPYVMQTQRHDFKCGATETLSMLSLHLFFPILQAVTQIVSLTRSGYHQFMFTTSERNS